MLAAKFLFIYTLALVVCCALAEEPTCNTKEECDLDHTSLLQTYASLNQHHVTQKAVPALDPTTPLDAIKNYSDRTLHVTFHDAGEMNNTAALLMKAMKEAGVTLGEWEPVSFDGHNHTLDAENNTFPFVWDFTVRHVPLNKDLLPGESESDSNDEIELEFLPPPPNPNEKPHDNVSFLEVEDTSFDLDLNSNNNESFLEVNATKKNSKKNGKQKKWVAKALAKLKGKVCARPGQYYAKTRFVTNFWYVREECSSSEWRTERSIFGSSIQECVKHCDAPPGRAAYTGGKVCTYNCQKEGLEHISTDCLHHFCASDTGACVAKYGEIALSAFEVLSNLFPPFKSVAAISKAVKTGSKAAIKKAVKAAAKKVGKKLLKSAKSNLKKHMKQKKKELKDEETQEAIFEAGAELFVLEGQMAMGGAEDAVKNQAMDLIKAVDPTGISDLISALETDSCDSKTIPPMPLDGLEDELTYEMCSDCHCGRNTGGYWGTYDQCGDLGTVTWPSSRYVYRVKCSVLGAVYTYRGHSCPQPRCTRCTCSTNYGGYWGTYGSCEAPHNRPYLRYNVYCEELDGEYTYKSHSCR